MSGVRRSDEDIATVVLRDGQITYLFVQQYWDDENSNTPPVTPSPLTVALNGSLSNGTAMSFDLTGGSANSKYEITVTQVNASTGVSFEIFNTTITRNASATQTITGPSATTGFMYVVYVNGSIALTTPVC